LSCFFFFFQAEDGIRDLTVTGVQTCALPISPRSRRGCSPRPLVEMPFGALDASEAAYSSTRRLAARAWQSLKSRSSGVSGRARRSEERRVGKEGRARRSRGR